MYFSLMIGIVSSIHRSKYHVSCYCFVCVLSTVVLMYSCLYAQQGSDKLPHNTPAFELYHVYGDVHPRISALGTAGCALTTAFSGSSRNPALAHMHHIYQQDGATIAAGVGIGLTPMFDAHLEQGAGEYTIEEYVTTGISIVNARSRQGNTMQRGRIGLSTRIFPYTMDRGPIDIGIHLRASRFDWRSACYDSLPLRRISLVQHDIDTLYAPVADWVGSQNIAHREIGLDVGIYQRAVAPHVDFGAMLGNALGYSWQRRRPSLWHRVDTVYRSAPRDTLYMDSLRYADTAAIIQGWMPGVYRTFTAGIVFRKTIDGFFAPVMLHVPVDVSSVGLLSGGIPIRFFFRCGIQTRWGEVFTVRTGYAYAPIELSYSALYGDTKIAAHSLSAGGGIDLDPLAIDLYVARQQFGIYASLHL